MNVYTVAPDTWTHIEGSALQVHHTAGCNELVGVYPDGTLSLDAADFVWRVRPCNGLATVSDT